MASQENYHDDREYLLLKRSDGLRSINAVRRSFVELDRSSQQITIRLGEASKAASHYRGAISSLHNRADHVSVVLSEALDPPRSRPGSGPRGFGATIPRGAFRQYLIREEIREHAAFQAAAHALGVSRTTR